MAGRKKGFQWRRWNNLIHRDLGYLCVGLTVVFAISGIAVNHRADWNPNYDIQNTIEPLEQILDVEPGSSDFNKAVVDQLDFSGEIRGSFRQSPTEVDIFMEDITIKVNTENWEAAIESIKARPILRETNFLHLNEAKKWCTYMADVYAVSLLLLATTGMFMLKGRKGIKGRGKWLTLIGVAIPLVFLLIYF